MVKERHSKTKKGNFFQSQREYLEDSCCKIKAFVTVSVVELLLEDSGRRVLEQEEYPGWLTRLRGKQQPVQKLRQQLVYLSVVLLLFYSTG